MSAKRSIITVIIIILGMGVGYYFGFDQGFEKDKEISSFEECAAAGYPIMESYPEQCRTPGGKNFTRNIEEPIIPSTDQENGDKPVACTLDAMQCPDGSYVGRTGPKCEFVCPTPTTGSGVRGTVMLGPTCPVVQYPPAGECDDEPFKTNLVLTTADGMSIVKYFSSDGQGKFSVSAPPGFYLIRSASGGPSMPSCAKSEVIEVKANSYTITTVSCDTGIR